MHGFPKMDFRLFHVWEYIFEYKKCIFHVCIFAFCCSRLFEKISTYVVLIFAGFAALADLAMLTNLLTLHHTLSSFAMEPTDSTRQ